MHSTIQSRSTTAIHVAQVPYLNSVPFYAGLQLEDRFKLQESTPRELGERAAAGRICAGPLPLADYLRLEESFERLGRLGIAVRGHAHSALLFAKKPIRQLDDAIIAITKETSTTACALHLILEKRYKVKPKSYQCVEDPQADALLLIGDEALRFRESNRFYPYEIDVAFEWWLWQHLPLVFCVWAIRKDADSNQKKTLERSLSEALGKNLSRLGPIAEECSQGFGIPAEQLQQYLSGFIYRLSELEEEGIKRFGELVREHGLL